MNRTPLVHIERDTPEHPQYKNLQRTLATVYTGPAFAGYRLMIGEHDPLTIGEILDMDKLPQMILKPELEVDTSLDVLAATSWEDGHHVASAFFNKGNYVCGMNDKCVQPSPDMFVQGVWCQLNQAIDAPLWLWRNSLDALPQDLQQKVQSLRIFWPEETKWVKAKRVFHEVGMQLSSYF